MLVLYSVTDYDLLGHLNYLASQNIKFIFSKQKYFSRALGCRLVLFVLWAIGLPGPAYIVGISRSTKNVGTGDRLAGNRCPFHASENLTEIYSRVNVTDVISSK